MNAEEAKEIRIDLKTKQSIKERPIIFTSDSVKSILEGRKSQTRRVLAPQPKFDLPKVQEIWNSPYGNRGDRLWVRESYKYYDWSCNGEPYIEYRDGDIRFINGWDIPDEYANRLSDIWADLSSPETKTDDGRYADTKWRPSIFMPCWASRITLEIESVRVEMLQDITPEDAREEGIEFIPRGEVINRHTSALYDDPILSFRELWDSINMKRGFPWESNPWVWAIGFRVIENGK